MPKRTLLGNVTITEQLSIRTGEQLGALPQGALIMVTWSGGNGPHIYKLHKGAGGYLYAYGLPNSDATNECQGNALAHRQDERPTLHEVVAIRIGVVPDDKETLRAIIDTVTDGALPKASNAQEAQERARRQMAIANGIIARL